MNLQYSFKKTLYKEKELLEDFSLSRSYLHQIVKDWIDQGRDPAEMGKLQRMSKTNLWDPRIFLQWIHNNKLYNTKKYHNEDNELKKVSSLFVVNNSQERKTI